jgi:hypothetical protein
VICLLVFPVVSREDGFIVIYRNDYYKAGENIPRRPG